MSKANSPPDEEPGEPIPWLQKLYDRPLVLLVLGLVVMFGFYTIWGMWEVLTLPPAKLP